MTDFFKFRQDLSEKKAFNLKEGSMKDAAKELEDYAKKSSSGDKNDFMKAVSMMKKQDEKGLAQFVNKLDTDPKEKIIDTVKNALGKRKTEKLFDVKVLRDEKELDPVKDKALDKKFKNRKDKDIDNDGDVDSSDEYLHKRRKAIDKAMDKESGKSAKKKQTQLNDDLEKDDDDPCWDGYVQVGTKMKDGKEVPKCVPMEEARRQMVEARRPKTKGTMTAKELKPGKSYTFYDETGTSFKATVKSVSRSGDNIVVKYTYDDNSYGKKGQTDSFEVDTGAKTFSESIKINEAYDTPDYGPIGASEMKMTQLHFIKYAADEIIACLESGCVMPEWYQNKVAKVEGEVEGLLSYMKGKKRKGMSRRYSGGMYEETLTESFSDQFYFVTKKERGKTVYLQYSGSLRVGETGPKWIKDPESANAYLDKKDAEKLAKEFGGKVQKGLNEEAKSGDKEAYRKFFNKALKKFGVDSPAELKGEKEKEFYDYVDKNWKSDKEQNEGYKSAAQRKAVHAAKDERNEETEYVSEKLKPSDDVSKWIEDFYQSDAPQFEGKSKEERREMAVAAWLDARREAGYDVDPNPNK